MTKPYWFKPREWEPLGASRYCCATLEGTRHQEDCTRRAFWGGEKKAKRKCSICRADGKILTGSDVVFCASCFEAEKAKHGERRGSEAHCVECDALIFANSTSRCGVCNERARRSREMTALPSGLVTETIPRACVHCKAPLPPNWKAKWCATCFRHNDTVPIPTNCGGCGELVTATVYGLCLVCRRAELCPICNVEQRQHVRNPGPECASELCSRCGLFARKKEMTNNLCWACAGLLK